MGYPVSKGMTDVSAHGDEPETAEPKKIIDLERMMEGEGLIAPSSWPQRLPLEEG